MACVLAPTALFPFLAAALSLPLSAVKGARPMARKPSLGGIDLDVLIPAYREGAVLTQTLDSVMDSYALLRRSLPSFTAVITVGLQGADEATRAAYAAYAAREGLAAPLKALQGDLPGKWPKLEKLVEQSEGRWCALVDAGTLWPRDLLPRTAPAFTAVGPAGLAPGYRMDSASAPARAFWALESAFKRLENLAGGPVSVHGATVFYRARELKDAFAALKGTHWLNDDVAIAMMVRAAGEIDYRGPAISVSDIGAAGDAAVERHRRVRMMEGNLQWIGTLWPLLWRRNPMAALIASRRVARTFWAPLAMLGAVSLSMALRPLGWIALIPPLPLALLWCRPGSRAAFQASLRAPFSVIRRPKAGVRWT